MLSIYHAHVAIMLSYSDHVIWISISFLFAQIVFFFSKKLIYNYIYTQIYSLVYHTRIKDRESQKKKKIYEIMKNSHQSIHDVYN